MFLVVIWGVDGGVGVVGVVVVCYGVVVGG